MEHHTIVVEFQVEAEYEADAAALVQYELSAHQEVAIDSVLGNFEVPGFMVRP